MKQHTRTLNGDCPACIEAGQTRPDAVGGTGLGCLMAGSHVRGGRSGLSSVSGMEALNEEVTGMPAAPPNYESIRSDVAEAMHNLEGYPPSAERDAYIAKLCTQAAEKIRRRT